jgi:hypothetical protein
MNIEVKRIKPGFYSIKGPFVGGRIRRMAHNGEWQSKFWFDGGKRNTTILSPSLYAAKREIQEHLEMVTGKS